MIANDSKSVLERAMSAEHKPLSPQTAREILEWHLTPEDDRRMSELEEKSRQGLLDEEESEDLREFCTTVDLLSLMHLRAKEALGILKPANGA